MSEFSDIPSRFEISSKLYELQEPLRILRGSELVEERFGDERRAQERELNALDLGGEPDRRTTERAAGLIMAPHPLLRVPVPNACKDSDIQSIYEDSVKMAEAELAPLDQDIKDTIDGSLWDVYMTCKEYSDTHLEYRQMLGEGPSDASDTYIDRTPNYRSDHSGIRAIEEVTENWVGEDGRLAQEQFGEAIREAIRYHLAMTAILAEAAAVEFDARATAHKFIYALLEEVLAKLVHEIDVKQALADGSLNLAALSISTLPFKHVSLGLSIASFGFGIAAEVIPEGTTMKFERKLDQATYLTIVEMLKTGFKERREELAALRHDAHTKLNERFAVYVGFQNEPKMIPGIDLDN